MSILAEVAAHPLFLPAWVFGVIGLVIFALLGFATFTYRDVANRHAGKADKASGGHH